MNPFRSLMGRREFTVGALAASTSALPFKNIANALELGASSKPGKRKGVQQHKIVTFGNQGGLPLGHATAADLSLSGQDVTILDMPGNESNFEEIREQGGIVVTGNPEAMSSGKIGFAEITNCTTDPEEALAGADLVIIDAPIHEIEEWVAHIVPYVEDNAILHFTYYGYWPALRIHPILKGAGKENVTVTECPSAIWLPQGGRGSFEFARMRPEIPLSAFPANRSAAAFQILGNLFPAFVPAKDVIETNFMNLNMIWHASIALLNVARFDRVKASGEDMASFYSSGVTESTSLIAEAQDNEREAVCNAYEVPYRSLMELEDRFFNVTGETVYEVQRETVKNIGLHPVEAWKLWTAWDIPFAIVPFISLAELAGIEMPVNRSLVDIFGVLHGKNFWEEGLTLNRLGLEGKDPEGVIKYVHDGI